MRILSKIMISVLLLSIFIISLKYINIYAYASSKGSTIGSVNVDKLSEKEMEKQINEEVMKWKKEGIYITVGAQKVLLNGDDFLFDVDTSIRQYKKVTEKPWYAFWKNSPTVHEPLIVSANSSLIKKINSETNANGEEIKSQILEAASYLKKSPINIKTNDLSMKDAERISFQTISLKDTQVLDVSAIAKGLDGVMIEPETRFSFNEIAKKAGSNDDMLTIVASALYSTILQSSFEITERHQADDIPTYVKPGYEASVSPFLEKDLQFISHSTAPAKIVASVKSNNLKVELYSLPGNPEVTVTERDRMTVQSRTIYRYSKNLAEGTSDTIQQAKSGLQLLIYRTITDENGDSKTQLVSQNYYAPKNEIIEKSSIQKTINNTTTDSKGNSENNMDTEGKVVSNDSSNTSVDGSNTNLNRNQKSSNSSDKSSVPEGYKRATKSKNGESVPKGSYYNNSGDIVTPKDTK